MVEKGIAFFDSSNMDKVLKAIGKDEEHLKNENCVACGCQITKDNIGGITRSSPIRFVCKKFSCVMSVLLAEKKEILAHE